jgi:hypothetical protein
MLVPSRLVPHTLFFTPSILNNHALVADPIYIHRCSVCALFRLCCARYNIVGRTGETR